MGVFWYENLPLVLPSPVSLAVDSPTRVFHSIFGNRVMLLILQQRYRELRRSQNLNMWSTTSPGFLTTVGFDWERDTVPRDSIELDQQPGERKEEEDFAEVSWITTPTGILMYQPWKIGHTWDKGGFAGLKMYLHIKLSWKPNRQKKLIAISKEGLRICSAFLLSCFIHYSIHSTTRGWCPQAASSVWRLFEGQVCRTKIMTETGL